MACMIQRMTGTFLFYRSQAWLAFLDVHNDLLFPAPFLYASGTIWNAAASRFPIGVGLRAAASWNKAVRVLNQESTGMETLKPSKPHARPRIFFRYSLQVIGNQSSLSRLICAIVLRNIRRLLIPWFRKCFSRLYLKTALASIIYTIPNPLFPQIGSREQIPVVIMSLCMMPMIFEW